MSKKQIIDSLKTKKEISLFSFIILVFILFLSIASIFFSFVNAKNQDNDTQMVDLVNADSIYDIEKECENLLEKEKEKNEILNKLENDNVLIPSTSTTYNLVLETNDFDGLLYLLDNDTMNRYNGYVVYSLVNHENVNMEKSSKNAYYIINVANEDVDILFKDISQTSIIINKTKTYNSFNNESNDRVNKQHTYPKNNIQKESIDPNFNVENSVNFNNFNNSNFVNKAVNSTFHLNQNDEMKFYSNSIVKIYISEHMPIYISNIPQQEKANVDVSASNNTSNFISVVNCAILLLILLILISKNPNTNVEKLQNDIKFQKDEVPIQGNIVSNQNNQEKQNVNAGFEDFTIDDYATENENLISSYLDDESFTSNYFVNSVVSSNYEYVDNMDELNEVYNILDEPEINDCEDGNIDSNYIDSNNTFFTEDGNFDIEQPSDDFFQHENEQQEDMYLDGYWENIPYIEDEYLMEESLYCNYTFDEPNMDMIPEVEEIRDSVIEVRKKNKTENKKQQPGQRKSSRNRNKKNSSRKRNSQL